MSQVLANSSPDLTRPSTSTLTQHQYDDSALEGVAANVKLLLKLIEDHRHACDKEKNGSRRMLRVATMITILDSVRDRIRKCQSFGHKSSGPELRRCSTMIPRPAPSPAHKPNIADDENERLRRELALSLAAQRNLQAMCSSLGKEKEIMAAELSRKVRELTGTEELIDDLRAQNETLLERVKQCASDHKEKKPNGGIEDLQLAADLHDRNRVLSDQLLKSLDGYRSMKRKLRAARDENGAMRATLDEMRDKILTNLERVRGFKGPAELGGSAVNVGEEILALEGIFECFRVLLEKHEKKQGDCVQNKGEIGVRKPSVLA